MKCTKGEYRGAIALGCILAVVLAVLAWRNRPISGGGGADRLPDAVKLCVDSTLHAGRDSIAVPAANADSNAVHGKARGVLMNDAVKRGKSKETRPQPMRPSPLDDVNS